jgi:hypothetical protein
MSRRVATGDMTTLAGALAQSSTKEKAKLKPVTIRMPPYDLEAARRLAAEKGLPYQTYIKVLLREALRRENTKITELASPRGRATIPHPQALPPMPAYP